MPSKYTLDTLPTPGDDRVRLVTVPAETGGGAAVHRRPARTRSPTRTAELLRRLNRNNIEAVGDPLAWFYDPPWTMPFRRRNEVVVGVAEDS